MPKTQKVTQALAVRVARSLEDALGGREQMMAISDLQSDPRFVAFTEQLANPSNRIYRLETIARACKISPMELLEAVGKGVMARAVVEARIRAAERLPDVVAHTATDALSRDVPCSTCNRTGVIEEGRLCPSCNGDCYVRLPGNQADRKHILEMGGLVGKSSQPTVAVTIDNRLPPFEETIRPASIKVEAKETRD